MSKRKNHSPEFKVKVALEALKGPRTVAASLAFTPDDPRLEAGASGRCLWRVPAWRQESPRD